MSYILEALKKSESERNQGRVPNLGQQMRMVHRKRKRGIPALVWLAIALTLNAVVLAVLFWPGVGLWWDHSRTAAAPGRSTEQVSGATAPTTGAGSEEAPPATSGEVARAEDPVPEPAEITAATGELESQGAVILDTVEEAPTVIVPTVRQPGTGGSGEYTPEPWEGRVPHLVELPMAFQRQVPDLVFNSHVYSSRPSARSVMINNRYLRMGDSFGPLRVERITQEGVELSMDGQRFRVGVVRDWSSPR
ncbi:general secretion pathway protein GspB [Marinobacter sp. OP 3.4]|uniref:general secretion pathway protein GspB n=1 Tax=Marinobacter sp. OP 3.4 TaxID=3076501 RepID=UPI002E240799